MSSVFHSLQTLVVFSAAVHWSGCLNSPTLLSKVSGRRICFVQPQPTTVFQLSNSILLGPVSDAIRHYGHGKRSMNTSWSQGWANLVAFGPMELHVKNAHRWWNHGRTQSMAVSLASFSLEENPFQATMFALLAGCANIGNTIADYVGAYVLEVLQVHPTGAMGEGIQFQNLWKASCIVAW